MIIDGKKIADDIQSDIKLAIQHLKIRPPCLAVILVGNHLPSQIYIQRKTQACHSVGIRSLRYEFPEDITEDELIAEIVQLSNNSLVDGILIQLPLPPHINSLHVIHAIDHEKDVDGFHPYNVGKMLIGETDGFFPCTPLGIKVLMQRSDIDVRGKHVLIVGRSNIVGKPLAAILMQGAPGANATVTVAHRYSLNLNHFCHSADVIIVAVGQPNFITGDMVKEGVVVIDVGINKITDLTKKNGYSIVGDVEFSSVSSKSSLITPVPGGVGPMTIAMLLHNTLLSHQRRFNLKNGH